jgi:hypothetical protein
MSDLVPDPKNRSDSQITPAENRDRDRVDLYFQDLIVQEQISLASTIEIDERKKKLELIQMALNLEGQMVDLQEKKNEASRKDDSFYLQLAQDNVKLDIARIDLIDRQTKSTDLRLKTILRLIASPVLISTGGYLCFASDSLFAPILLFLGLLLAFSNEDPLKVLSTVKDILPK